MGLGNFVAIVWGVQSSFDCENQVIIQWSVDGVVEDSHNALKLKLSYESHDPWLGFVLADDNGNLNTYYRPNAPNEDYYPQRGFCFYGRAIALNQIEAAIEQASPGTLQRVKAAWSQFSTEMKAAGTQLPEPALLIVSDYN